MHERGKVCEEFAAHFLMAHDLEIVQRNFKCRIGELDIVALDRGCLVFVEVRYRRNTIYGTAIESVTLHKQRRVALAAQYFLHKHIVYQKLASRFDVVAMSGELDYPSIEWIKDAFDEQDIY